MVAAYILVLGEREALTWVVREHRMAFPPRRLAEAQRLRSGDRLFFYASRGAFHNPTRDRGRIFGEAEVATPVSVFDQPLELAGRQFTSGCQLRLRSLARMREGVELAPLVPELEAFPDERSWPVRLRRPLVPLTAGDALLIRGALKGAVGRPADVLGSYAT
jgi:hypothetical protein